MMAGLKLNLNQPTYIWRGGLSQYALPPGAAGGTPAPATPTGTWCQPATGLGPDWPGLNYNSTAGSFTETLATDGMFSFDPGGNCDGQRVADGDELPVRVVGVGDLRPGRRRSKRDSGWRDTSTR